MTLPTFALKDQMEPVCLVQREPFLNPFEFLRPCRSTLFYMLLTLVLFEPSFSERFVLSGKTLVVFNNLQSLVC